MSQKKQVDKLEEYINDLEVYIECLKDITEEFKTIKNPSYARREEFFNEYINLEDNIIGTLNEMDCGENEKVNRLIEQFNIYWRGSQDSWDEENWTQYEYLRKCRDRDKGLNGMLGINNSDLDLSNITKSENKKRNSSNNHTLEMLTKEHKKEETLGKIDEELKNVDEDKSKELEKKRGCTDCLIF